MLVQFGNNWIKKIPGTAKLNSVAIWQSSEFFSSNYFQIGQHVVLLHVLIKGKEERSMNLIPGSLSFAKLVMMSSASSKSAGDARYTTQDPFIKSELSPTIHTLICIRTVFMWQKAFNLTSNLVIESAIHASDSCRMKELITSDSQDPHTSQAT